MGQPQLELCPPQVRMHVRVEIVEDAPSIVLGLHGVMLPGSSRVRGFESGPVHTRIVFMDQPCYRLSLVHLLFRDFSFYRLPSRASDRLHFPSLQRILLQPAGAEPQMPNGA